MKPQIQDYCSIIGFSSAIVSMSAYEQIIQISALITSIFSVLIGAISLVLKIISIVKKLKNKEISEDEAAEKLDNLVNKK